MKKWTKITCAVVVLAAVAIGAFFIGRFTVKHDEPAGYGDGFYATIESINGNVLLVQGLEVNDINHRGHFTFSVDEDTVLEWHYTKINLEDLQIGDIVGITNVGAVLETYPARLTKVTRVILLDDDLYSNEVSITDIVDRTETEPLVTADALEGFWKDDQYTYAFSSIKSHYIIVHYSDGTEEPVREAMEAGRVTIADLDRFGIGYYKEEIVTAVGMECKEGVLTALGLFWSDEQYDYYYPCMDTEVTVLLSDGHSWPLQDALMAGLVTVSDLDRYDILYYKEPKQ